MTETFPVTVTFKNMELSSALESEIRTQAADLARWFDRIHRCRVVVELPHRHHRVGRRFNVHVEVSVPGEDVIVSHEGTPQPSPEGNRRRKAGEVDGEFTYAQVAVRGAFEKARRRLQEFARRRRGDVKAHTRA